jgi:hypothetical protein
LAVFLVGHVRTEPCLDGIHRHIEALCTYPVPRRYSRREVADSIKAGHEWYAHVAGGSPALVRSIATCPRCTAAPYLTTRRDDLADSQLDLLPEC